MFYNASNNAWSRLSSAISASATSLTVQGGNWPEPPFLISIEDEIIEVNNKSGNTFSNLVRGMEGTTPAPHPANARVENRFTAGTYNLLKDVLTDSRIVEHNLDVADPPNGYYVRWGNGLQVCWHRQSVTGSGLSYATLNWTYSAAFVERPIVVSAPAERYVNGSGNTTELFTVHAVLLTTTDSDIRYVYNGTFDSTIELFAHLLAIGRWK